MKHAKKNKKQQMSASPQNITSSQKIQLKWVESHGVEYKEEEKIAAALKAKKPSSNPKNKRKTKNTPSLKSSGKKAKLGTTRSGYPREISVDEELDLHEHNIDEALAASEIFLHTSRKLGHTCVRIIHGMGGTAPHSIAWQVQRNLKTRWNNIIRDFSPEPGNPGATIIHI